MGNADGDDAPPDDDELSIADNFVGQRVSPTWDVFGGGIVSAHHERPTPRFASSASIQAFAPMGFGPSVLSGPFDDAFWDKAPESDPQTALPPFFSHTLEAGHLCSAWEEQSFGPEVLEWDIA